MLLKASVFGLTFFFASGRPSAFFAVLFLIAALLFYLRLHGRERLGVSFWVAVFAASVGLVFAAGIGERVAVSLAAASVFYVILSLAGYEAAHPAMKQVYAALNTLLVMSGFAVLGLNPAGWPEWIIYPGVFVLTYGLFREAWTFLGGSFLRGRKNAAALIVAYAALQIFWAVSLWPIGFFNAAALLTVSAAAMRELGDEYFRGRLNRGLAFGRIGFYGALAAVVIFVSRWQL